MEFLKLILGEELYKQVAEKVNAHNGDEANKDNQIKIANLGTGEYIGKGKYTDLENQLKTKDASLVEANNLIAEFKKNSKGNEDLQSKITNYEGKVQSLEAELQETKKNSAIKVALLSAGVTDLDYVTYKLVEKGEIELDEKGEIKGIDDKIAGLKTQLPQFFKGSSTKVYDDNKLPGNNPGGTLTRAEILKKPYVERVKLFNENPEAFRTAMNENK